ncbi:unnamed protein product [Sympodiomycopsis kandeliae]
MADTKPFAHRPQWSSTPPAGPPGPAGIQGSNVASPSKSYATPPPFTAPPRIETLDLKGKLAAALGRNAPSYWNALQQFALAKISRDEFEQAARICLKPEHVHLHNSLVLGILYNASSAVPGPSAHKGTMPHIPGARADDAASRNGLNVGEQQEQHGGRTQLPEERIPPKKRLRMLAASLSIKERQRIKASGKEPDRAAVAGANTSSWAGAGADLLEKRRKEEEKKSKEAELKRRREVHTEIGSLDWTREALIEEVTKQELRAKVSVATLQALLRAPQVLSCRETKCLPEPEPLADLMTAPAVEAGLSGGVAPEASQLLIAGLQMHLQNVAGSIINAVRANRAGGGIRFTVPSREQDSQSADTSFQSNSQGSFDNSPVGISMVDATQSRLLDVSPGYPSLSRVPHGARSSGQSSRNSTASNSASIAASSIFDTGNIGTRSRVYAGNGPDASVSSFASTAPTSVALEHSESNSDIEMDLGETTKGAVLKAHSLSMGQVAANDAASQSGRSTVDDDSRSMASEPWGQVDPLPHRPLYSLRGSESRWSGTSKLALRDVAFMYDLSPHVAIEPPGLSVIHRLLAADVDEVPYIDEDADSDLLPFGGSERDEARVKAQRAALSLWQDTIMQQEDERLAHAARKSALSRHADLTTVDKATASGNRARSSQFGGLRPATSSLYDSNRERASREMYPAPPFHRKHFVIDQQGPLSLLGEQNKHSPSEGNAEGDHFQSKGLASSLGKRARSPHFDPMADVVDTTQLLAGLCG